jgi:hypothetical protein
MRQYYKEAVTNVKTGEPAAGSARCLENEALLLAAFYEQGHHPEHQENQSPGKGEKIERQEQRVKSGDPPGRYPWKNEIVEGLSEKDDQNRDSHG